MPFSQDNTLSSSLSDGVTDSGCVQAIAFLNPVNGDQGDSRAVFLQRHLLV
ncbi:hypothetical protein [Coleofasciculus sp. E2-BRE-01]|uniref:hypothetical protein n=1 Tax=Coleofasciculus sp. E2-BRE-01 TaxID=3069524 RepID=UPI0032F36DC6